MFLVTSVGISWHAKYKPDGEFRNLALKQQFYTISMKGRGFVGQLIGGTDHFFPRLTTTIIIWMVVKFCPDNETSDVNSFDPIREF